MVLDHIEIFNEDKCHNMILWITGEHEKESIEIISEKLNGMLVVYKVSSWNDDLSLWKAPSPFHEEFAGQGHFTFDFIENELCPYLKERYDIKNWYVVGYSLAGLMALYILIQSQYFHGAASCSGSLWFEGFEDFVYKYPLHHKKIYLSLGNREHRTKNKILSSIKEKTENIYHFYLKNNTCFLEYNPGNHFQDHELRLLKAMKYLTEVI